MSYLRRWGMCAKPHHRSTSCIGKRQRTLRIEPLETRYALSTLTTTDPDDCLAVADETTVVESSTTSEETTGDASTVEQDFVGPLESDAYFEAIGATESDSTALQQEGESVGAPSLEVFGAVRDGLYWIFSGKVTDDHDPSNCRVYFGGALQGSTPVMSDGTFAHYALYWQVNGNIVTAVAIDAEGNESNTMTAILSSV